jgi:hypothetical protein
MSINFEKLEENEPDFAKLHAKGTGVGALMNMETAEPDAPTHSTEGPSS